MAYNKKGEKEFYEIDNENFKLYNKEKLIKMKDFVYIFLKKE
jgi:hypothetical protein